MSEEQQQQSQQPQGQQLQQPQQHTASVWNSAGTFEERDVSTWAKQRLQALLPGCRSGSAVVTGCKQVSGHATLYFIRGRKRSGFELDLHISFAVADSGSSGSGADAAAAGGTLRLKGVTPDDLDDCEPEVSLDDASGGAGAAALLAAGKSLTQPLREVLSAFLAELRAL